eukprot:2565386-Pleurochrysis_carterae.AAC.1
MQRAMLEQMQAQMKSMQEHMQAQMQAQMQMHLQAQLPPKPMPVASPSMTSSTELPPPQQQAPTTPFPPITSQFSNTAARMQGAPSSSFGVMQSGECIDSTPPDLVMKRQQLAGLLAIHAAEPSNAARAGMIAELRFDIQ